MAILIDGKMISAQVRAEIAEKTSDFVRRTNTRPGLAVIIVGEDPASQVYVRNKARACEQVGFYSETHALPAETSEETLLSLIDALNKNEKIHGILVQLPLPKHLDEQKIILAIDKNKDVDAFHPYNVGRIMLGEPVFLPCTPAGVMELLRRYQVDISGKECVVVGRSNIVGKPMAMLLLAANGTVTICHSRTAHLAEVCRRADILICAIGKPNFFTADMVKPGAVAIDVGINRGADGKLCGDVDFASVEKVASYLTPVPGGVGPMTITMLLQNTLRAAEQGRD